MVVTTRKEIEFIASVRAGLTQNEMAEGRTQKEAAVVTIYKTFQANKSILKRPQFERVKQTARDKLHELIDQKGWEDGREFLSLFDE